MGEAMKKMRESTGGGYEKRGAFFIRVTVGPQRRQAEHAPWAKSLDEAIERGRLVQGWVTRLRQAGQEEFIKALVEQGAAAPDEARLADIRATVEALTAGRFERIEPRAKVGGGPTTFRTFAERWTSGELARLYPDHIEEKASVQDDVERFEKHIFPHVEDVPLVSFTRGDADRVMAKLPSTLKRGTRRQVAQLVNRVLRLAVFAGETDHCPLPPGWLPKAPKAESIAKEALLPSEEARLLGGRNAAGETVVPLEYRVAYAFLHREGMRKGEARALEWASLDLERGIVSLDENKTDRPRSWVLDAGIAKVLGAWKKRAGTEAARVFTDIAWEKLAPVYRAHCEAVGIARGRLFEKKANKLRLRAHDMRAFFVTAAMYAGKDALWITDRSGHTSLGMLRTYERDVRRWRELGEAPVDVAGALPEFAAANAAAGRGGNHGGSPLPAPPNVAKVHGKGLEPLRLAAAEPKASQGETSRTIQPDSAPSVSEPSADNAPDDVLPPRPAAASGPSEAELEAGILEAVRLGLGDVARTLAAQLDERRRARAANVVDLGARRRGGR